MQSLQATESHLRSLRNPAGHWRGELSSSALSTATAVVALHSLDPVQHARYIEAGVGWLAAHQNEDGGWGDTTRSCSNLSTTQLCLGALIRCAGGDCEPEQGRAWDWIRKEVGSVEPAALIEATIQRYGKDRTFSVPILMHLAICGVLGDKAWRAVLPLPFELAALPRNWFGAIGLPVVSYALPALIAIGHARFHHAPPGWWNPLRGLRALLWKHRIRPMLKDLQPSSGGYLEATPLTSFVTMALANADQADHPAVEGAVAFLHRSMREDGSWPIDTDLATWGTTLAVKSGVTLQEEELRAILDWLLEQQYHEVHPFTNAAPGGWAWTELPGGVPDADDTPGALLALHRLEDEPSERVARSAAAGVAWLLDLQNRDGGVPTFCRGWGTLPFDRSTPELTAHALRAWESWRSFLPESMKPGVDQASTRARIYLAREQRANGSWIPLWFGNEAAREQENPVYGTAQVLNYLLEGGEVDGVLSEEIQAGLAYLEQAQQGDGGWAGDDGAGRSSVEETAVALAALGRAALAGLRVNPEGMVRGRERLEVLTDQGRRFPSSPIGLYFARLWYHEELYPVVWTLDALRVLERLDSASPEAP